MQKQWHLIRQFPLPCELKDGIVYLQRALRDFITQHQILASKIKILPIHQRAKIKQCMRELEEEMRSIGEEQEGLVRHISERVKRFQLTVQSQKLVTLPEDLLCGFVAQQLNRHSENAAFNGTPKHISPRMNATELAEKYCLESILGQTLEVVDLVDVDDDSILLDDPWATGAESKPPPPASPSSVLPNTYIKESPTPSTSTRSLLKSKQERQDQSPPETSERPFAAIAESLHVNQEPLTSPDKSSDDEPEEVVESCEKKVLEENPVRTGGVWMPGLRGRPPKGVKYVPAAKLAIIEAQRQAVAQKRTSKRKEVLEEKIEPIDHVQDDSAEEDDPPLVMSAAVRRGRSNLLQALNKQKRGPGRPNASELLPRTASTAASKRDPTAVGGSKLSKHASYTSSGSSPNSRSSTPTWGMRQQTRGGSDDSCDRRSSSTEQFPSLPDPGEPSVSTPATIYELGQMSYLRYLGLYTPEEAKALKERKRERKRRSCYSTERKDFHYGKLDYYEQQQQYQVARAAKRQNKRPILYSPPVAVAKKRKHPPSSSTHQQQTSSSSSRPRLPPANIFAAMDIRSCFVCYKTGTTDELSACMNCCNIYHLDCHNKIDEQDDAYRQRDNLCPLCLATDEANK
uniref:PHD-type domain-containing protein n=1 Tax=Anopheles farauti TaxID=69004 RepID=A0A182Q584_9DIPT